MKGWMGVFLAAVALMAAGCQPANRSAGYTVVFDGAPQILDEAIYFQGVAVGRIIGRETAPSGKVRLAVDLDPQLVSRFGWSLVFYAGQGRVNAARLKTYAPELPNGAMLSGFSSKAALNWFKLKTLLSDRVQKAQLRAQRLNRHFG